MSRITYVEHRVPHNGHYLYAREYPGKGPAILLLQDFRTIFIYTITLSRS